MVSWGSGGQLWPEEGVPLSVESSCSWDLEAALHRIR